MNNEQLMLRIPKVCDFIAPLDAQAQCIAGHPRSDATAGRCPPTGGTADKVRNFF